MAKCAGITRAGTACKGIPIDGSQWCYAHHPDRTDERQRHGSKGGKRGGRGRGNGDIKDVKAWLLKLASDVEEGRLEAKDGSVVSQILNVFLRGVEVERRIKESEKLEGRLEALESVLKGRKAG